MSKQQPALWKSNMKLYVTIVRAKGVGRYTSAELGQHYAEQSPIIFTSRVFLARRTTAVGFLSIV